MYYQLCAAQHSGRQMYSFWITKQNRFNTLLLSQTIKLISSKIIFTLCQLPFFFFIKSEAINYIQDLFSSHVPMRLTYSTFMQLISTEVKGEWLPAAARGSAALQGHTLVWSTLPFWEAWPCDHWVMGAVYQVVPHSCGQFMKDAWPIALSERWHFLLSMRYECCLQSLVQEWKPLTVCIILK